VDNHWVPANPVPGAIVVNTGDLLEQWSGGYFPATVIFSCIFQQFNVNAYTIQYDFSIQAHRVLIPQAELDKKCNRLSMVYFVHPDDHVLVTPLESEAVKEPKAFEPITAHDHCRRKLDQTYS
jgi:isopenicillin N synthase-like dioxygenase